MLFPVTGPAVLGVDIGTSSTKGVLVAADGRVLGTAVREHAVDRPRTGHFEMDAGLWWAEVVSISRELLRDPRVEVGAVGVSGMGPCVLLADEHDRALRPAILYGIDTRAEEQIATLTDRYGEDAIAARCGSTLSSQAVGPKLAWLAENEPDVFGEARRLYMASSWLVAHLTGEYVLDHHSASQSTPLYDSHANEWYEPWAAELAGDIELPRLAWPGDVVGTVTADAAAETGLPAGIPVIAGTVDAWSEAVSVGAQEIGDLMLMYGSTMFLVHTVAEVLSASPLWSTVGVYPGTACLAGGMATSGSITGWLRDLFGSVDYAELVTDADTSGIGANGLLLLPYFAGERTPIADPRARGAIVGLTLSHTRGDLYRAALEAIAFGVRHNIEAMEAAGARIDRVVAVGGGTQGGLWTQIVSDVTGRSQEITATTIGASYGAAFLAASAIGRPSISDWNPITDVVEPTTDAYDDLYELYRSLYPATRDVAHRLAERQLQDSTPLTTAAQKGTQ
jgi:xylulokinase